MYIDKNKVMEALSKDDVIRLVISLGSNPPRVDGNGDLIFQSVCHGSDSWKLYYYHEARDGYPEKIFHCYSGCSDSFGPIELIIRANRCKGDTLTFYQALSFLAKFIGYDTSVGEVETSVNKSSVMDDWKWLNRFKNKTGGGFKEFEPVNECILEMFNYKPHELFLSDHISREVLSEFEISYWGLTNQIILPHRDKNGTLIGIRGRYLDKEDIENIGKYVPITIQNRCLSHSLGKNLYGIHINQEKIKRCKKCMLVESEKGVMQNHTYFGNDDFSLAVCGSSITNDHRKLLLDYLGVEELIVAFDKEFMDNESWEASIYRNKLLKKVASFIPYCKVSLLWDFEDLLGYKDSPTDKGKEILLRMLDNKVEITMEDLELLHEEELQNG